MSKKNYDYESQHAISTLRRQNNEYELAVKARDCMIGSQSQQIIELNAELETLRKLHKSQMAANRTLAEKVNEVQHKLELKQQRVAQVCGQLERLKASTVQRLRFLFNPEAIKL